MRAKYWIGLSVHKVVPLVTSLIIHKWARYFKTDFAYGVLAGKFWIRVYTCSILWCLITGILAPVAFARGGQDAMQMITNFSIDRTEVTVEQYAKFVSATGYVTAAERRCGGLVFASGWEQKAGWVWSSPFGSPANPREPAVHLTFNDAVAYCAWAGKRLPTDEEWALAAYTEFRRSPPPPFKIGQTYPYPTGPTPDGANCFGDCGSVSVQDYSERLDRGRGPALAGTTAPGVNGLHDMGANVWEWTDGGGISEKRTRGGSWWYGAGRMRAADLATKPKQMAVVYIGFRCAKGAD